jgi:hypothetical protein
MAEGGGNAMMLFERTSEDVGSSLDIMHVMGASRVVRVAKSWARHGRRFVYFAERDGLIKIGTGGVR